MIEDKTVVVIGGGSRIFNSNNNVTSVVIPDSVISIGNDAFRNCSKLASVTIGNSVTPIGDYAFYRCTSIESVYFTGNAPVISSNAFYSIPRSNFTLYHSDIATGWDTYESIYNTAIGLHIVAFNNNGGSAVDSQVVLSGEKATKPTDPTKTGVIFEGWYKDADFSTPWDFDTETVEASIMLYAKWPVETAVISISEVTGVSIPVTGTAPDITVDETEQYTAAISWLPADATFNGSTVCYHYHNTQSRLYTDRSASKLFYSSRSDSHKCS